MLGDREQDCLNTTIVKKPDETEHFMHGVAVDNMARDSQGSGNQAALNHLRPPCRLTVLICPCRELGYLLRFLA